MQYKEYDAQDDDLIRFNTFEVIDKNIYAQVLDKYILVRLSRNANEVVNLNHDYCFMHCAYIYNRLYFIDYLGKVLVEYDINNNLYNEYKMDSHIEADNNVLTVEVSGNLLYIVLQYQGTILIFNSITKKFEHEMELEKKIKRLFAGQRTRIIGCRKMEECLYLIVNIGKSYDIWKYNMTENCLEELPKKKFDSMRDIYCIESKVYILQDDVTLCIWDLKNNQTEVIRMDCPEQAVVLEKYKNYKLFSTLAVTRKNVWLFPAGKSDNIYIYDLLEKEVYRYDGYPDDFFYLNIEGYSKYSDTKERGGLIYVPARLSNYYLTIDIETGNGIWNATGSCSFREYYCDVIAKESGKVFYERNKNLFDGFLCYDQKTNHDLKNCHNFGSKIWEALK